MIKDGNIPESVNASFSESSWLTFHSRNSFICKVTIFNVQNFKFKIKVFRVKKKPKKLLELFFPQLRERDKLCFNI